MSIDRPFDDHQEFEFVLRIVEFIPTMRNLQALHISLETARFGYDKLRFGTDVHEQYIINHTCLTYVSKPPL